LRSERRKPPGRHTKFIFRTGRQGGESIKPVARPVFIIILFPVLFAVLSCSAVRKPAPEDVPPPTPAYLLPTVPGEADILCRRLARVAESISGVRSATVILSHTTAIAGLELYPGIKENKVFPKVARKLREQDARIRTVRVTSEGETVARIKEVAREIHNGKPVTAYSEELVEIMRRAPRVKQ